MTESAVLFPSCSFASPLPHSEESHEDNPIHELSQSVSLGRFMTEDLEWGKWSSFLHKKYVDEAEKYSKPGSVAQKKAFFEAHYKRIADAKKAKASHESSDPKQEPESVAVLLNTLETLTKDEVKEEESDYETELVSSSEEVVLSIENDDELSVVLEQEQDSVVDKPVVANELGESGVVLEQQEENVVVLLNPSETLAKDEVKEEEESDCETELVLSSEELVLSIENDDEPERKSGVVLEEEQNIVVDEPMVADDLGKSGVVLEEEEEESVVHDEIKGKNNNTDDEDLLKKSSSSEEKEERIYTTKNSAPLETPDKGMELVFLHKLSERPETHSSLKRQEKPVRQRFSFLNCLMGNTKTQDQNTTRKKRKTDKKPNKSFMCLCFKPEMVCETEVPTKTQRGNI